MYKLITKISLFRFGVKQFMAEVNKAFADGYVPYYPNAVRVEKKGLRIVCVALLVDKAK